MVGLGDDPLTLDDPLILSAGPGRWTPDCKAAIWRV